MKKNFNMVRGLLYIQENFKMAKVLISMPEQFLDQIDAVAGNENRTRSELIREALRTYINRNNKFNAKLANRNAEILEALLD